MAPNKDKTASWEQMLEVAVAHARKYLAETADANARPLGTRRISKADQKFDYDNRGPDYWPRMLKQAIVEARTRGHGVTYAIKLLLEHDKEMRNGSA